MKLLELDSLDKDTRGYLKLAINSSKYGKHYLANMYIGNVHFRYRTRYLYELDGLKTPYSIWIKRVCRRLKLVENKDYICVKQSIKRKVGGTQIKEYYVPYNIAVKIALTLLYFDFDRMWRLDQAKTRKVR